MPVTVEEAEFAEVDAVHRDVPEFDADHLVDNYPEKGVSDADPALLVARVADRDVGYLVAYDKFGDGSYYVWMAGVVPQFRRQGVMSALVDRVTAIARDGGYDALKIKTRNERRAMRQFLAAHGFAVCGFDPVGDRERHEIMHVRDL